ncbi:hypothetical protein VTK26DRAFT_7248 [Humicola hyalothermophila]
MAPRSEGSHLKRARAPGSPADAEQESFKKPRRSERLSQRADNENGPTTKTPVQTKHHLPSPLTNLTSETTNDFSKEATATPPEARPSQGARRHGEDNHSQTYGFSSPPHDTQAFSQQDIDPNAPLSDEVEDETKEGVWGYLFPLDTRYGICPIVLKKKGACQAPDSAPSGRGNKKGQKAPKGQVQKGSGLVSGGYLIGRHPECDIRVDEPQVSNRHCLLFTEHKGNDTVAIIEDLSSNGTYVNEAVVGRNQRRELKEYDEISILADNKARFFFRYPKNRHANAFLQQYTAVDRLGKGFFAEVYLCIEKSTGQRYAVKRFTKTPGAEDRSKNEALQQEIAMLMGVSHPSILCLKDIFNEANAVYLVLELAPGGELFNYIITHQKLSEAQTRKVFLQLFEGVKYLHDRNIVHRDIKPENILLADDDLNVKLADFGLAKIIGEDSFTATLCGTPSYVAPEILADSKNRRYNKAVDIWSLGVVLYICLCGFPPFSDELYHAVHFPYRMKEQIIRGVFEYPSPYWDPIGDTALDLIDNMLVVDPDKRYTIDQCLAHPWMTQNTPGVNDSTNGLVSGLAGLEMSRRGITRERTLLADLNRAVLTNRIPASPGPGNKPDVKVYAKNPPAAEPSKPAREMRPADNRDPDEFVAMGGKGDQVLFGDDVDSRYTTKDVADKPSASKAKGKGKGKGGGR